MYMLNTYIKNLETGDVQHTNEVVSLVLGIQSFVDSSYERAEHTVVQSLGQSVDRVQHLVFVTTLGYELVTDLDLGLQETLDQVTGIHTQQEGDLLSLWNTQMLTDWI